MTTDAPSTAKSEALTIARRFLDPQRTKHKELLMAGGAINLLIQRSPIVGGPRPQEVVLSFAGAPVMRMIARRRGPVVTVSLPVPYLVVPRNVVNGILIELGSPWRLRPVGSRLLAYDVTTGSARVTVVSPTADLDPMTMDAVT